MSFIEELQEDRNNIVNSGLKCIDAVEVTDLVLRARPDWERDIIINYESFCALLATVKELQDEVYKLRRWKHRCTMSESRNDSD